MDLKQWCKMLGDPTLPKQETGDYNAIENARWNRQVFDFLTQYEHSFIQVD
jgi:hypothetical protein